MSRLVLLNLSDSQVDVLSRIEPDRPRDTVLVYHSDPEALVVRLARLADWSVPAAPPEPRPDDLVVAEPTSSLAVGWRTLGAAVVAPHAFTGPVAAVNAEARTEPASGSTADTREVPAMPKAPAQPSAAAPDPGKPAAEAPAPARPEPPAAPRTPAPAPAPVSGGSMNSLDALRSPESTFAWLVREAAGSSARAALWWDGAQNCWTPWVWTGEPPTGPAPDGPDLETEYGRFRVSGLNGGRLDDASLRRTAEDLALRDLWRWQRESAGLTAPPLVPGDASAAARWLEHAGRFLAPEALFLWEGDGNGWELRGVHGEGFSSSGVLRFPDGALQASFERDACGWNAWTPAEGFRAHIRPGADPRWVLRWHRFRALPEPARG